MAHSPQSFYGLWQDERIRETLFEILAKDDICSVRLASSACCNLVTKRLFLRTHLTFTANTFTKASRVQALSRIGHHIEHLTFSLAHSDATFLPPLIHPLTGREISFLYTPHTCMMSALTRPKYANTELGDVLTQQYPPLFHAATNVPSFINAIKHMPNMRHLTIKCPGQDPTERYRRGIVDYALISLRISIERAPLHKLSKLSLSGVHPAAFNYLRHVPGFGSHPSAARRWRQIRKLYMSVDTWDFYGPSPGLDHLKIIDDYIRNMAPHLEKFSFTWINDNGSGMRKGPCPIALAGDALFSPSPAGPKKLFNEVTGPMSPLPPAPRREAMHMPRLRNLTLRNATMNTPQLRDLVERHKATVREFDFENVSLADGGSYEEAFSHLLKETGERGHRLWSRSRSGGKTKNSKSSSSSGGGSGGSEAGAHNSPTSHHSFRFAAASHIGSVSSASSTVTSGPAAVASPDDVQLPSPSAAVAAVSRELLDLDVEDLESYLGLSPEPPFVLDSPSNVSASDEARPYLRTPPPPPIGEADEDDEQQQEGENDEDDGGLASDVAAAHENSLEFSTCIKKRRVHRSHRRRHRSEGEDNKHDADDRRSRSRRRHHRHHHPDSHRDEGRERRRRETSRSRSQSRSHASHGRRHRSRKGSSATSQSAPRTPPPPPLPTLAVRGHPFAHRTPPPQPPQPRPAIVGQYAKTAHGDGDGDDDSDDLIFGSRCLPESPSTAGGEVAPLTVPVPTAAVDLFPVVLQPTVYDPSATPKATTATATVASPTRPESSRPSAVASPAAKSPVAHHHGSGGTEADGLSAIQREFLQEQAETQKEHRHLMASDPDARTSALKKAKEAVLTKLGREFSKRMGREAAQASAAATAATAAAAAASVSMSMNANVVSHSNHGWGATNYGAFLSDNGHSSGHSNATAATLSLLAGLRLRERLFGDSSSVVVPSVPLDHYSHRSMESNSAVVPLIFSRA